MKFLIPLLIFPLLVLFSCDNRRVPRPASPPPYTPPPYSQPFPQPIPTPPTQQADCQYIAEPQMFGGHSGMFCCAPAWCAGHSRPVFLYCAASRAIGEREGEFSTCPSASACAVSPTPGAPSQPSQVPHLFNRCSSGGGYYPPETEETED